MYKPTLKEVAEFLRPNICLFGVFLTLLGYVMFNPLSPIIVFLAVSSFLISAGGYSLNDITDSVEDRVNRGRVNALARRMDGRIIMMLCFIGGFLFSALISRTAAVICLMESLLFLSYSLLRFKKLLLVKNLYTGFGAAMAFLFGACPFYTPPGVLSYYLILSSFITSGSVISDLRDYSGDKAAGIKTLATFMGVGSAKAIVYLLLFSVSLMVTILRAGVFYSIMPFLALMAYYTSLGRYDRSHLLSRLGVLSLLLWGII